ncbi:MAG: histidine kinase, partial [Cyclobacteriaceae bacterium]|nr:histidine kinase [Cyclobacteriaceae bacterium]
MNKKKLYWFLQVGGWSAYTAAQIILLFISSTPGGAQIVFLVIESILFFILTHNFRRFIKKGDWISFPLSKIFPRVLVASFLLGICFYFLRMIMAIPLGLYNKNAVFNIGTILGLTIVFALVLFIWQSLYFAYHYFYQYNQSLKEKAAMKEIELTNLKAQLNPHFIFNALNSIRALVNEDPKKSKNAITQLSNILRNSLITDKKRLCSLEEELTTVKDYLGLEGIRYEERLEVHFDIDPASLGFLIPPLMLQTLIENGVKHGISKLKNGGKIEVKSRVLNNILEVEITNSGRYSPPKVSKDAKQGGMGLVNTRQRLELLYGKDAILTIGNVNKNSVLTTLKIPQISN